MSTPEEHQQHQQQREQREQQEQEELRRRQYAQQQDPYGTQTWQSDTWDTSHQPVYPALGAVPGQPAAPEGWFRDEAPAAQPQAQPPAPAGGSDGSWPDGSVAGSADPYTGSYAGSYEYPAAGGPAQQPVAPEGWFRDEVPAQAQTPAPAPVQDWSQGGQGAGMPAAAAEQTAYMPPYPGPAEQAAPAE
ncbi:hypothetical protein ACFWN4_27000, partial [Streptomyces sp. NPDC058412]